MANEFTDPRKQAEFERLRAEWDYYFPSFKWTTYENLKANPNPILQNINEKPQGDQNRQSTKQDLYNKMQALFSGSQDFPKIEDSVIKGLFDPLRTGANETANALRPQIAGDINRASAGATDLAGEALAGTGVGRSGIAANTFQGIEQAKATQTASSMAQIETARQQQLAAVTQQEQAFRTNQVMSEQGFDVDAIRSTIAYERELMAMNFQAAMQFDPGSWLDNIGDIIDLATTFSLPNLIGPSGTAAVLGIPA